MPKSDMHPPNTYTPEMYRAYVRSLMILIAGGAPRAGETDRWLERLSGIVDVGFSSLRAAWGGRWISRYQYVSKRTLEQLRQAAANARKTNDLVTFVELQIDIWETAPEFFEQRRIEMAREFVAAMRRYDAERGRSSIPADDEAGVAAVAPATR